MTTFLTIFIFAFGAVIGSFLNAVLWRLRTGESVVFGRSYCPSCHHELAFADLFPILSFLMLGGRCRYCRKGIHPSYLAVEVAAGAMFVLAAAVDLGPAAAIGETELARLLFHWAAAAVLLLVFVYDGRYMLVPRKVVLTSAVLAFAGNLALGADAWSLLLGVAAGWLFFQVQFWVSGGRWVGGGDASIGVLIGALLGFKLGLTAIFLAYIVGALVGVLMIVLGKKTLQSRIPFGTFLSAAAFVVMLYGERLLGWYLDALRLS